MSSECPDCRVARAIHVAEEQLARYRMMVESSEREVEALKAQRGPLAVGDAVRGRGWPTGLPNSRVVAVFRHADRWYAATVEADGGLGDDPLCFPTDYLVKVGA